MVLVFGLAACDARTSLPVPDAGAGGQGTTSSTGTGADRVCPPECAIGHLCCLASCDGPAVALPNDCCTCISGEVDSSTCPNAQCGKP